MAIIRSTPENAESAEIFKLFNGFLSEVCGALLN